MKRNLRKALAFAVALGTVITSVGVPADVNAAEYEEPVELLETCYLEYEYMGDGIYFASHYGVAEERFLSELAVVNKNGEVINVEVIEEDGSYKYKTISSVFDDGAALIRVDGSYALLCPDGTVLGEEESYSNIGVVQGSHYIVSDGEVCNLIDRAGNVIVENIFTPIEAGVDYMPWYRWEEFWDGYTIVERDEENGLSTAILDEDFKMVEAIDMTNKSVGIVGDSLIVCAEKEVTIYEKGFVTREKQLDLSELFEAGYIVNRAWENYDYTAEREILTLYLSLYEDGVWMENKWVYYDLATLEEVDESSIQTSEPFTSNNEISYTDITYVDKDGVREYYQNEKLLFTTTDIADYVMQQKEVESVSVNTSQVYAYNGELFIGCGDYTVIVAEHTGYDINQASILDNRIYVYGVSSYENCLKLTFTDGTFFFNGEFYNSDYNVRILRKYQNGEYNAYGYIFRETNEDGTKKSSIILMDGTCIFETNDIIASVSSGRIIIENAIGEYECIYLKEKVALNESLMDKIEAAVEGDSIETTIEQNEVISAEVIGAIKDLDIELVITTPSGITWTINGKDITGTDLKNVDLTVDIVKDVVPTEAISAVKVEGEKLEFSLAHTGDFGFKAELKVNVDTKNADKYANLFYYNPASKELEFQSAAKIDKEGNAVFTYTHASDYVIIINEQAYTEPTTEPEKDTEVDTDTEKETEKIPNKGDAFATMYMLLLLGVAVVAVGVVEKKKANHV